MLFIQHQRLGILPSADPPPHTPLAYRLRLASVAAAEAFTSLADNEEVHCLARAERIALLLGWSELA